MPLDSWTVNVEDSIDSQPFAVVDDIIVVVRTPRSRDFVTVEVGRVPDGLMPVRRGPAPAAVPTSRPVPWINEGWCGEVHVGRDEAVALELDGEAYQLSLEWIHTSLPWASYQFRLERQAHAVSDRAR